MRTDNRILILASAILLAWSQGPLSAGEPALRTQLIASGFNRPLFVTAAPLDDRRLFVVEQDGRIRILNLLTYTILPSPFLNIDSLVGSTSNEQGLLALAFHPDYQSNGFFYVNYTNNSGNTVIARYAVSANPDLADAGSAMVMLNLTQPFVNHNGGTLAFGPDGYLYLSFGDGGSAGDPGDRAQNPEVLLGKMLRIDVDGGVPYGIPADNPFVGVAGRDEIWALGLRNPWRFSFDRMTGDIYIGDVGQDNREEITFQPASSDGGENYGWRCREGTACFSSSTGCTCASSFLVDPIHDYSLAGPPCAVVGGYMYRGCAIPELQGTYFFADHCSNQVWSFRYDGVDVTDFQERTQELAPTTGMFTNITSFGEDGDGELIIVDRDGELHKIVGTTDGPGCPALGDCDGDNDTDLLDFGRLQLCYSGPGGGLPDPDCTCNDFDADGDVDLIDFGQFQIRYTGPCGVRVTESPVSADVSAGCDASLSVEAQGAGLTYQWRRNGVPLPGATTSTLSLLDVDAGDAGGYSVLVSGTCGGQVQADLSLEAALNVLPGIEIELQPMSTGACEGSPASLSIVAASTAGPLSYQWFFGSDPIPGATGSTLEIPAIGPRDVGTYYVLLQDSCTQVTSALAAVDILIAPTIDSQPIDACAPLGGAAVFFVIAGGSPPVSYQWYHNGLPIDGETSILLVISGVTAELTGTYHVEVTNPCGTTVSDMVQLDLEGSCP